MYNKKTQLFADIHVYKYYLAIDGCFGSTMKGKKSVFFSLSRVEHTYIQLVWITLFFFSTFYSKKKLSINFNFFPSLRHWIFSFCFLFLSFRVFIFVRLLKTLFNFSWFWKIDGKKKVFCLNHLPFTMH